MRQERRFFRARLVYSLSLLTAGLVTLAGCGDGKIATYPVSGTVKVDGQTAEGAILIFCPTEGSDQFKRERPFGATDASGKFQLTTFLPADGAPAGDYKVMIRWPAPRRTSANDDPNRGSDGFDRFNGRYFDPNHSGLTATVAEEPTELPPFELKSR